MVNAQEWLDVNYPEDGVCQRQDDKENYGKRRNEIINLDISNQNLVVINSPLNFSGFTFLNKLNCSFNRISYIRGQTLVLEEIDYSHNYKIFDWVSYDDRFSQIQTSQIKKLNLSYDGLKKAQLSSFSGLTHLDVSNNDLQELDLQNSNELVKLNCSNNPFLDKLNLPSYFNPTSLDQFDCRGTGLRNISTVSSMFDCQSGSVNIPFTNTPSFPISIITASSIGGLTSLGVVGGATYYVIHKKRVLNSILDSVNDNLTLEQINAKISELDQYRNSRKNFLKKIIWKSNSNAENIYAQLSQQRNQLLNASQQVSDDISSNTGIDKIRMTLVDEKPIFEEKDEIGSGGFGKVYHGKWKFQDVAVKKLNLSPHIKKDVEREISNLKNLRNNKYIIQYYGTHSDNQEFLIIMEYAENGTLTKFINDNKNKEQDWKLSNEFIKQIVLGLTFIHHENIIHRDLKSMNILLTNNYHQVKISDFGLSRTKNISSSQTKDIKGTLQWMAPELLRDKNYSEQSDIYALGMVIWEIAAKCTMPFKCIDYSILAYHIISGKKETIPSDTPRNIQNIIRQCWKDNPAERIALANILEKIRVDKSEIQSVSDDDKSLETENTQRRNSGHFAGSKNLGLDLGLIERGSQLDNLEIIEEVFQEKTSTQTQIEQPPK
ncbi:MAG: hypothetical protein MRERC_1c192 [Mycoplasmataceae bacterium RC_NB112A]|nr:MAG: hypothetical protein MRERC_1c192 [Mycoplasmataceae bacterium RC_NB112A]